MTSKKDFLFGAAIGFAAAGLFSFYWRRMFVEAAKREKPTIRAQYILNRVKGILDTYYKEEPAIVLPPQTPLSSRRWLCRFHRRRFD